jgi:hypothetical protein
VDIPGGVTKTSGEEPGPHARIIPHLSGQGKSGATGT